MFDSKPLPFLILPTCLILSLIFCSCQSTPEPEEHKDFSFWPLTAAAVKIADDFTASKVGTGSQCYASLQRYMYELDVIARRCQSQQKRHGLPALAADWFAGSPEMGKLPPPAEEYRESLPWLVAVLAAPDLPSNWSEPLEALSLLHRQQEKLASILDWVAALDSGSGSPDKVIDQFRLFLNLQNESRAILHKHFSQKILEPAELAEKSLDDCLKAVEGLAPFYSFQPLWEASETAVPEPKTEEYKPTQPTAFRLLADADSFALDKTIFLAQKFDRPEAADTREIFLILPPLREGEVFLNGKPIPASANYSAVLLNDLLFPGQTQWLSFRVSQRLTRALTLPWLAIGKKLAK